MKISDKVIKKISAFATQNKPFFFIIDFEGTSSLVLTPEESSNLGIFYNVNGLTNYNELSHISRPEITDQQNGSDLNQPFKEDSAHFFKSYPVSFEEYYTSFNKAQRALQRGDTYLINLTFKTKIETNLSLAEIFLKSKAKYKLYFQDKFVVFSPEMFIKISGRSIETRPMKGTISANIPNAENLLMENLKEIFEHNTIVDLLRNDMNIVAENVVVQDFRYVERIHTHKGDLLQVSSLIKGELPFGYEKKLGDIINAMLPAGSVTGAPKKKTVEIIREIENYQRGYYTGVFGFFNGYELEVAVSIRFIEKDGRDLYFKSGGGITALSNPIDEYHELINKIYVPIL
jgi:para-aminobenzoate synthetase component 1